MPRVLAVRVLATVSHLGGLVGDDQRQEGVMEALEFWLEWETRRQVARESTEGPPARTVDIDGIVVHLRQLGVDRIPLVEDRAAPVELVVEQEVGDAFPGKKRWRRRPMTCAR
jgi:hypothetical protein